jgi:hypothetical protein
MLRIKIEFFGLINEGNNRVSQVIEIDNLDGTQVKSILQNIIAGLKEQGFVFDADIPLMVVNAMQVIKIIRKYVPLISVDEGTSSIRVYCKKTSKREIC